MKNYSSVRAGKGKTAYRTPSVFRYRQAKQIEKIKTQQLAKKRPGDSGFYK